MFKKSKKPLIEFICDIPGLDSVEECLPKPAIKYVPEWFKSIPNSPRFSEQQTIKACPSFPDFFGQGFIIPMWADTILNFNEDEERWSYRTGSNNHFKWDVHPPYQFTEFEKPSFIGNEGSFVFKAISPWRIVTPPGWSVMQLPLFYHFDQNFSVMPGVIDTDMHYQINQQVLYHGKGEDVFIKRGTPFVQYVPFERKKMEYAVRFANENDQRLSHNDVINYATKFIGEGAYRMARKPSK